MAAGRGELRRGRRVRLFDKPGQRVDAGKIGQGLTHLDVAVAGLGGVGLHAECHDPARSGGGRRRIEQDV